MNYPNRRGFVSHMALLALIFSAGCQTAPLKSDRESVGSVTHVVVCWLKNPGNPENRLALIRASQSFTQISGVVSVRTGSPLPSTRPVVDTSYDVAVVITFDSVKSLRDYDHHPTHLAAVKTVLGPLVSKLVIYDFENAP